MIDKQNNELEAIVNSGNELEILKALRRKIAQTMDDSNSGRDIAALSKQLREVTGRISDIEMNIEEHKKLTAVDLIRYKAELEGKVHKNHYSGDDTEETKDGDVIDLIDSILDKGKERRKRFDFSGDDTTDNVF